MGIMFTYIFQTDSPLDLINLVTFVYSVIYKVSDIVQ